MRTRLVWFTLAAVVVFGGVAVATVGSARRVRAAPTGTAARGGPVESGTLPIPACTSYATHVAPSSGVVIPRYATDVDRHLAERLEIGIASLLLGTLAGLAWAQGRRRTDGSRMPAASA